MSDIKKMIEQVASGEKTPEEVVAVKEQQDDDWDDEEDDEYYEDEIENEDDMVEFLREAVERYLKDSGTSSYTDAGMLTMNKGLVIRFGRGDTRREFRITVHQHT